MSLPVILDPEAQAEFDEGYDFYEGRRSGLGERFGAVQVVLDASQGCRGCTRWCSGTCVRPLCRGSPTAFSTARSRCRYGHSRSSTRAATRISGSRALMGERFASNNKFMFWTPLRLNGPTPCCANAACDRNRNRSESVREHRMANPLRGGCGSRPQSRPARPARFRPGHSGRNGKRRQPGHHRRPRAEQLLRERCTAPSPRTASSARSTAIRPAFPASAGSRPHRRHAEFRARHSHLGHARRPGIQGRADRRRRRGPGPAHDLPLRGDGAYRGERRIRVSDVSDLSNSSCSIRACRGS